MAILENSNYDGHLGLAALGLGLCLIVQQVDQKERVVGLGPIGLILHVDILGQIQTRN